MTKYLFAAPDVLGSGGGWAVWEWADDGSNPKVVLQFVTRYRARRWVKSAARARRLDAEVAA